MVSSFILVVLQQQARRLYSNYGKIWYTNFFLLQWKLVRLNLPFTKNSWEGLSMIKCCCSWWCVGPDVHKILSLVHGWGIKYLVSTQKQELLGDPNCVDISIGNLTQEEAHKIIRNHSFVFSTNITLEFEVNILMMQTFSWCECLMCFNSISHFTIIRNKYSIYGLV